MSLKIILLIGLFGSLLMYIGDMLLYYDTNDYKNDDTLNSIIEIMKKENKKSYILVEYYGQFLPFYIVLVIII